MSILRYKTLSKGFVRPYLLKRLADYPTKAEGDTPTPPPPSQPPKPAKPKKAKAPPKPAATPKPSAPPTPAPKPAAHEPPPSTPAPQEPAKKPFAVRPEPAESNKLQQLRQKYSAQRVVRANQLRQTSQTEPDDLPEETLRKYPEARRQEALVPSGNKRPETKPVDVHLPKEEAERQAAGAHRDEGYKPPSTPATAEKTPQEVKISEALVEAFRPTIEMWRRQEEEGHAEVSSGDLLMRHAPEMRKIARSWMKTEGMTDEQITDDSVERVLEDMYALYSKYDPRHEGEIDHKQVQAMVKDRAWPMLKDYLLENVQDTSKLTDTETKRRVDQAVQLIYLNESPVRVIDRLGRQVEGKEPPLTAVEEAAVKEVVDTINMSRWDRIASPSRTRLIATGCLERLGADTDLDVVNRVSLEALTRFDFDKELLSKSLTGYRTKAEGTPPPAQPAKPAKAPKAKAPPKPAAAQPAPRPAAKAPAKPKPKPVGQQPAKATDTETRVEASPPQAPPSKIQELRQKYSAQHTVRANQLRPTNQTQPEEPADQPVGNEPSTRVNIHVPSGNKRPEAKPVNVGETPRRAQEIMRSIQARRDEERDQPRIMKEREEKRRRREEEMERAKPEKEPEYVENPEQTSEDRGIQYTAYNLADELFNGLDEGPNGEPLDVNSYESVREVFSEQVFNQLRQLGFSRTEASTEPNRRVITQAMEMASVAHEQIALLQEAFPNEQEEVNNYINNLLDNYGVRGLIEFDPEQMQERFQNYLNDEVDVDELLFPDPEVNLDLPDGWHEDNYYAANPNEDYHYEEEDPMP